MSIIDLYMRAASAFGAYVKAVRDDQWSLPTPCTEWDVRALVNHLVNEDRWVTPMLGGKTIAEVGDALDGDLLGDDPKAAWDAAFDEAQAAVNAPGAVEATVHASFGDISGEEYLSQLWIDHLIHGWDLARAIGADEAMDPELAQRAYDVMKPMADGLASSGVFGEPVPVPDDAPVQAKLLGLTGRQP